MFSRSCGWPSLQFAINFVLCSCILLAFQLVVEKEFFSRKRVIYFDDISLVVPLFFSDVAYSIGEHRTKFLDLRSFFVSKSNSQTIACKSPLTCQACTNKIYSTYNLGLIFLRLYENNKKKLENINRL